MSKLNNLKNLLHRVTVLAQEDDLDHILNTYDFGDQINDDLYVRIKDMDLKISEESLAQKELQNSLKEKESLVNSESFMRALKLKEKERQLVNYENKLKNLELDTEHQIEQNKNIDVLFFNPRL